MANRISPEKRRQIVELLVEGNSCRSVSRIVDVHMETVLKALNEVAEGCRALLDCRLRDLNLGHVQVDEIWTFCGKKQGKLTAEEKSNPALGEQFLFVALDEGTKLIASHYLGKRTMDSTERFLTTLSDRMVTPELNSTGFRPQVSSDAFVTYAPAMDMIFANTVRYGQIVKNYAEPNSGRYAPPVLKATERRGIVGIDDLFTICTSHVERLNLSLRTFMKRFTRLALGFSKKWSNLRDAIDLHVAFYNFCWVHSTIKTTPAVAAGIASAPWTVEELLSVCEMF